MNNDSNIRNILVKNKLFTIAILGYIISYIFFYIRYTYFTENGFMRFPIDMMSMNPPCNDLWVSITAASKTMSAGTITGANFVYSPLFVVIYNILSKINFFYLRWISYLSIVSSYVYLTFKNPLNKYKSISHISLYIIFTGFLSYGLRFELERGQWNLQTILLCFIALKLKDHINVYIKIIAYILFTLAIHLKDWPIIFIFNFININESIYENVKTVLIIFLLNTLSLFVLGVRFLKEFITKIAHVAAHPDAWVANISLTCFNIQLSSIYNLNLRNLNIITYIYTLIFLICIFLAYNKKINGNNPLVLLLCSTGAILFPSVSFDYKICILTVFLAHFFNCYEIISLTSSATLCLRKYNNFNKISYNLKSITELSLLSFILILYPPTLYSYIYKYDLGYIGASDSIYVLLISLCTMILIYIQPKKIIYKI